MVKYDQIASLDFYTEGPAVDPHGNIYFTTLKGGNIYKFDLKGNLKEWAVSPCPNGQIVLPNGDHLICDCEMASIRRYDANGRVLEDIIRKTCAGVSVDCPNDLVIDKNGNLFFTDSIRHKGKIFCITQNGQQKITWSGLDYPNGLIISDDGRWLYVAESYKNKIIKIDLLLNELMEWAVLPTHSSGELEKNLPDGLAKDKNGFIWVAHYGMQSIYKLSHSGSVLQTIDTSIPLTSNLVFSDENTLIVTGGYGEPGPGRVIKIEI